MNRRCVLVQSVTLEKRCDIHLFKLPKENPSLSGIRAWCAINSEKTARHVSSSDVAQTK